MSIETPTLQESIAHDGRPDDCLCGEDDLDVACWPCYRDGFAFEEPNPEPPADDEPGR